MNLRFNKHFILIFLAAALWGMIGIFVDSAKNAGISEMPLVFSRALITAIIVGFIILFKDKKLFKIKLKDVWIFIVTGLASIVLFNYAYFKTINASSFSVAAVLLYTAPFFVILISVIFFKEKLTLRKLTALFVAFIGCCFVSNIFNTQNRISSTALIFGLLTGFGYGLYTIFGNILLKRGYSSLTITFYIFLFAAILSLLFTSNITTTIKLVVTDYKVLLVVSLMAFFNSVLPYLLYTNGLKGVEPSVAPIIATVEPVVATIVGVFYHQPLNVYGVIGIVLVLCSVVILNKKTISIKAAAKINLSLSVLGKREDGYHLLDSIMHNLSLYDRVTISLSKKIKVITKSNIVETENIVFKAAKLFFEETKITSGAKIKLTKKIPYPAGLGGGSADAAATLLGLDRIYNTNLSYEKLCEMALKLGADVPFFIRGGCQRAKGIGEILTKLKPLNKGYFILAKAGQKPSTKEMYQKIDSADVIKVNTDIIIDAIKNDDLKLLSKNLTNSFETVWCDSPIKERLSKATPLCVSLSGSGPTFFALFENKREAKALFKELKKEKIEAYFATPIDTGVVFE